MSQLSVTFLAIVVAATASPTSTAFNVTLANQTLHLAWSAYCSEDSLQTWDCRWCRTPYSPPPLQLLKYLKDDKAGTQGYVALDTSSTPGRVVVAYRGSDNLANTLQDAEFWMKPFGPNGSKVFHGFLGAYLSLKNDTQTAVNTALLKCPDCSVILTGHSLGAAMATIAAADLPSAATDVRLYTFGSPRTGNSGFVSWVTARLSSSVRMRRQLDIVPAIPPRGIGYQHVASEVWDKHSDGAADQYVVCNGSGEDPTCGDSEEHPVFPLDLLHLKPAEHTRYMSYQGGGC